MRKRCKTTTAAAAVIFLAAAASAAAQAQEPPLFLKGNVEMGSASAPLLEARMASARDAFRRSRRGDLYFTAHLFPGLSRVRHGRDGAQDPFTVTVDGNDVRFKARGRSQDFETENGAGPAGILRLHSLEAPGRGTLAARLIDPEAVYEFDSAPVFWLGEADAEASCALAEKEFDSAGKKLQSSLVFVISQHNTGRAFTFLRTTALGDGCGLEARREAVFWAACTQGPKAIGLLKEVLRFCPQKELKEQAVFALSLIKDDRAVTELISIAKSDPDPRLRKTAFFWLGQKASQESVQALKDAVDDPTEDVEVKEAAVFAVSQLPKDRAVPLLLSIARGNKSLKVRKQAIFWLGQTGETEALALFEEILLPKR
jgi:hypothetical protein